jgi:5-methylcytosine-specific restriction protein A
MPIVNYCSIPACPNEAVKRGRCQEHHNEVSRQESSRIREKRDGLYTDNPVWRKYYRPVILARHIVCQICHEQPSTIVDHIVAIEDGGEALKLDNLQGVCRSCHNRKTREEIKARGDRRGR